MKSSTSIRLQSRRPIRSKSSTSIRFAILFATAAVLAGCAARAPRLPQLETGAEGGRRLAEILAARPCPADLAANLDLRIVPAEGSPVRLDGALRAAWPDQARLQLRFGAFVPLASIVLRGDSAFVSLPQKKAYWSAGGRAGGSPGGSPGGEDVSIASAALLWLLCPSPLVAQLRDPVLEKAGDPWKLSAAWGPAGAGAGAGPGAGAMAEDGAAGAPAPRLVLTGQGERIDTIEIPDRDGGVAIRIERAAFRSTNGIDLPRSLRIEAMRPSLRVDARLTAAGPDPGTDPGRFRLPKPASFRRLTDRELVRILQEGAEGR